MTTDISELRRVLETLHSAWTTARTEPLRELFHPDMLIEGPGYQRFATGREACVESYREFSANAKVLAYVASEPSITVWADTAVCSYSWTMTWQRDEAPVSDTGTDQFVFARIDDRWQAVYRLVQFGAAA